MQLKLKLNEPLYWKPRINPPSYGDVIVLIRKGRFNSFRYLYKSAHIAIVWGFIAQIGRALHLERRGHEFESR